MKFSDAALLLDKAYAENLRQRRDIFQRFTQTRTKLFWTMATVHGIVDNACARDLISQALSREALFD